ncbi:hypothetical protein IMZ48_19850 [Candidatus Bathyarchaeota archaeon]|nr:hypothetical protein [Candidatus Bathyarchaeota archaeon]
MRDSPSLEFGEGAWFGDADGLVGGERTFGEAQHEKHGGNAAPGAQQRTALRECLHMSPTSLGEVRKFYESTITKLLHENSIKVGDHYQVNIVAE